MLLRQTEELKRTTHWEKIIMQNVIQIYRRNFSLVRFIYLGHFTRNEVLYSSTTNIDILFKYNTLFQMFFFAVIKSWLR